MHYPKIRKAIFPVGGLGTRFLPATKSMPKEMLPVANKPLIQYAFEEAKAAGIEQFLFITGRNKNAISNHFDHSYELQRVLGDREREKELALTKNWLPEAGHIAFIRQQEPLGLGHAVWCARHFIGDEPFAVLLADEMLMAKEGFLKEMIAVYEQKGGNIVAVTAIETQETHHYGIIKTSKATSEDCVYPILDMVEKPLPEKAPSNLAITGRYILSPTIFQHLSTHSKGAGGEIQLTDAMAKLCQQESFWGLNFTGKRFDCGNVLGFLEANIAYSLESEQKAKVLAMLQRIVTEYSGESR